MRNLLTFVFLLVFTIILNAQLKPEQAIKAMGRGINLGNTLDPPDGEGTWGNPAVNETIFDDYKNAGFSSVRIPITWDKHTSKVSPFQINETWLDRIEQVVDWALERKLVVIINAHHESWIKTSHTASNIARFDSIWSQVATRFQYKTDSLLFEMINEPEPLSLANVNALNARVLNIIRKTNPTRNVIFSGHSWANSEHLLQAAIPQDSFLIGYYHSYDPYPFGLEGPGTYGSDSDISKTVSKFLQVSNWSKSHNIPVILGEFAFIYKCEYNSRMCAYATVVEMAQKYNVPSMVWDDGGDFKVLNRNEHTWSEVKDILINTYPESPNKMQISVIADSSIKIKWNNRTTENDSIIIERRLANTQFNFLVKISPDASEFIDTTTSPGNSYYYRLKTNLKDSVEIQSYPIMLKLLPTSRSVFFGTPLSVPGTLECENYDIGGEGLTFHDTDNINEAGSTYRSDGVDVEDNGPDQHHIGYVAAGEWLEYTINVNQSGQYKITASLAAGGNGGGKFNLSFKNGAKVSYTAVATGSWTTFIKEDQWANLEAGEQIVRLNILSVPAFNIDKISFELVVTSVEESNIPESFQLFDNYPNPFNPSTTFTFNIPVKSFVTLKVFDVIGNEVANLFSDELEPGKYSKQWNATQLTSGVYFYRIQAGDYVQTKKLMILK